MTLRALIISDRPDYRQLLAHHVVLEWRDALPAEYEPARRGALPAGFRGSAYDVVLLDHEVQHGRGLEWLEDLGERSGFPPIVYLAPAEDAQTAALAHRAHALRVLPRADFEHAEFASALRDAYRLRRSPAGSATRVAREPPPPDRFGSVTIRGHRCLRRLAVGGTSTVFLAERLRTGEQVVLKVFRQVPDVDDANPTFERFLREHQLVSALRHPNVVRIHDIGVADDHVYLAMEYCAGGDLRARLREPLHWRDALALQRQMAEALGALHAVGVLHRDVKPGNVLLREDGSVAFIDFGLARRLGLDSDITGAGAIFGTPHYMSPEQGHGASLDGRSDLYSLGVILYEMLTARKPYTGDNPMAVIYRHAHEPVPALPRPLQHLQGLLERMLAKRPEDRPASVGELVAMIDSLLALEAA